MYRVAIIGRPNVGKSALFNRLAGRRIAIVDAESGVTRDRLNAPVEWNGKRFQLIDTGGLVSSPDELEAHIASQVELALNEADLLLFTVDGRAGRTAMDDDITARLRKTEKPVWLVATKADDRSLDDAWTEFAAYGWPEHFSVSALHGRRIGDLLDALADAAGTRGVLTEEEERPTAIAVVGRPNAGKSSLVNRLVGEQRSIVSETPGTTRDAVDAELTWNYKKDGHEEEKNILLIDTAGIRRGRSIKTKLDAFSINRAEKAIRRASVAILLSDAAEGVTLTDKKIANIIAEAGKGCVIAVNKWDLMAGRTDRKSYSRWVRDEMPFLGYAPLVFLSALTGENVDALVNRACDVDRAARQQVSTGVLNRVLHKAFEKCPPPMMKGRRLKLFYATQTAVNPPRFLLFVNDPRRVRASYVNYLVNQLRAALGFEGTPLIINWRAKNKGKRR